MSAGKLQWRKYAFFDKDVCAESVESVLGSKPSCSFAEGGMLLIGDRTGNVYISQRSDQLAERKYKIFRGEVKGLSFVFDVLNHRKQYVFAVGDDSRSPDEANQSTFSINNYVIKVFATSDMARPLQLFPVLAASAATASSIMANLTSFNVMPDGSQIAVGLSSGMVLLFAGMFLREVMPNRPTAIAQVLLTSHPCPVSGLAFCELASTKQDERRIRLYVVMDTDSNANGSSNRPSGGDGYSNSTSGAGAGASSTQIVAESRASTGGAGSGSGAAANGSNGDLTGLQADVSSAGLSSVGIIVFDTSTVITPNGIAPSPKRRPPQVLDERGAAPHCSALMRETSELVVAREEGVFTYSVDDRGGAAGFEGEKQCVAAVGRYILLAATDDKTRRTNITIYDLRNKSIGATHTLPVGERVIAALQDANIAYVLTSSYALIRFREKDATSKLDILLRKSLFPLAVTLAAEEQMDVAEISKLYKLYADHLYKKGEFDAAIVQYSHTIGYVPPSYVIRRFLDPQRTLNLVTYLEKLMEKGVASKDHSTLLLNCYTRLRDVDKISAFVASVCVTREELTSGTNPASSSQTSQLPQGQAPPSQTRRQNLSQQLLQSVSTVFSGPLGAPIVSSLSNTLQANNTGTTPASAAAAAQTQTSSGSSTSSVRGGSGWGRKVAQAASIDVPAAIELLDTAGFKDSALKLAVSHFQHRAYLKIQLSKEPASTDAAAALSYLAAMASTIINSPQEKDRGNNNSNGGRDKSSSVGTTPASSAFEELGLTVEELSRLVSEFGNTLLELSPDATTGLLVRLCTGSTSTSTSNLNFNSNITLGSSLDNTSLSLSGLNSPILSVDTAMSVFTGHNTHLLTFLEAFAAWRRSKGLPLPASVSNTLLELYLDEYQHIRTTHISCDAHTVQKIEEKIMFILDGANATYDANRALMLTVSSGFRRGQIMLLERTTQATSLLLKLHMASGDVDAILRLLRRDAGKDPEMFVQALKYFVDAAAAAAAEDKNGSGGRSGEDKWKHVKQLLNLIQESSVLPPMQVVSILTANPSLPLRVATVFLNSTLQGLCADVSDLENKVNTVGSTVSALVAHKNNLSGDPSRSNNQTLMRNIPATVPSGTRGTVTSASGTTSGTAGVGKPSGRGTVAVVVSTDSTASAAAAATAEREEEEEDELMSSVRAQEVAIERRKWESIRAAQLQRSSDHEGFYAELEYSKDKFATVATFFGKMAISVKGSSGDGDGISTSTGPGTVFN